MINHIKHKANGQPVANMWNSMMYHDNTGYHVAKIFCEHPVLSSLLVTFRAEMQSNYKTQLRTATSGNTSYSASSYSSQNRKTNDPRSATRVHIHRSGDRNQVSTVNRDAFQGQSWRRNDAPPPPRFEPQVGNTPTQVATHRRGMLQHDSRVSALPPQFSLASNSRAATAGAMHGSRSFTTADDRMLAEFAESRGAKRSDTGSSSSDREADQHANNARVGPSNNYRGNLQDGSGSRALQRRTPPPLATSNWRGADMSARRGYVQWQKDGRAAQVPVLTDNSPPGLVHSAYKNAGSQQPWRAAPMPYHLPSPAASSQPSKKCPSPSPSRLQGGLSQNQNHIRPASKPHRSFPGRITNPSVEDQQYLFNPSSSMQHSQSMPAMVQEVTQRLSALQLRAQAGAFKPDDLGKGDKSPPSIQDWVIETPTRATFETEQSSSSQDKALLLPNKTVAAQEFSPDKLATNTRYLDMEQKLKWYKARIAMLEVEIDVSGSTPDTELVLKWNKARIDLLEVEMNAAHREHEVARGDLAQPTDDHPPESPKHAHLSADWPNRASGSSIESAMIEPVVGDDGKICRSVSKNRLDKFTHIGQKLRHRRGGLTFGSQEFSGSFDARLNANVEDLLASPTPSGRYPFPLPGHTHAHPPQGRTSTYPAHGHPAADHFDSCTEGKYQQPDDYFGNEAHDMNSSTSLAQGDDDVFLDDSPRGRGHQNIQSPSSYGGVWLNDRYQ